MTQQFDIALQHLARVTGLAQIPREVWTEEDQRALRAAMQYLQQHQEVLGEGKREKDGRESTERTSKEP
jgi:hypothetical protein